MAAQAIRTWNAAHVGVGYIVSSGTSSHFMSAESLLEVMDQCYSAAIKLQREKRLGCNYEKT